MSIEHYTVCDECHLAENAEWDGVYWLPPRGWALLIGNEFREETFGIHLCPRCVSKIGIGEKKNG